MMERGIVGENQKRDKENASWDAFKHNCHDRRGYADGPRLNQRESGREAEMMVDGRKGIARRRVEKETLLGVELSGRK